MGFRRQVAVLLDDSDFFAELSPRQHLDLLFSAFEVPEDPAECLASRPSSGWLAMVPLAGGLGELWRLSGRRRWVVRSDLGLRADHLIVLTGLAAIWAAACAVRTVSRPLTTYDNLGQLDTPFGAMPVLAVVLLGVLPGYATAVVVALVVAFCVLRQRRPRLGRLRREAHRQQLLPRHREHLSQRPAHPTG